MRRGGGRVSCASAIKPRKEANSKVQTVNLPARSDRVAKHASRDNDRIFQSEFLSFSYPINAQVVKERTATQLTGSSRLSDSELGIQGPRYTIEGDQGEKACDQACSPCPGATCTSSSPLTEHQIIAPEVSCNFYQLHTSISHPLV